LTRDAVWFCCRVFNPTNRTIELPEETIVAMAWSVDTIAQQKSQQHTDDYVTATIGQMRKFLGEKQVL
jgi:hypothetical protein